MATRAIGLDWMVVYTALCYDNNEGILRFAISRQLMRVYIFIHIAYLGTVHAYLYNNII